MSAISNAVLLSPDEQGRVLALPREEFEVVMTEFAWEGRDKIAEALGLGGTMGPIPVSYTTTILRDALKAASTLGLGLTRFRGHPEAFARGVFDAQDASTIFA